MKNVDSSIQDRKQKKISSWLAKSPNKYIHMSKKKLELDSSLPPSNKTNNKNIALAELLLEDIRKQISDELPSRIDAVYACIQKNTEKRKSIKTYSDNYSQNYKYYYHISIKPDIETKLHVADAETYTRFLEAYELEKNIPKAIELGKEYWSNKNPENFISAEVIISPAKSTFIVEQIEKLPR